MMNKFLPKRLKRAALFFLLLMTAGMTKSLAQSTIGNDFWVTFMPNDSYDNNAVTMSLIAAGSTPCTGTVTNPYTNWSADFEVSVGATTIIDVPLSECYSLWDSDCVLNIGLHVVTTEAISLYASNFMAYSFDVADVLPTSSLGSNYVIQTFPGEPGRETMVRRSANSRSLSNQCSEFSVVAVEDNTTVYINLSCNSSNGHFANQPFSVTLNAGQCYQLKSIPDGDFTGSQVSVSGNKNVAVFAGNECANIPYNCAYCDHIVEQMMPVSAWGNHFVVTNSSMRTYDVIRVTAANNNCQISIDGSVVTTINQKETYQFEITSDNPSMYLETSEPAMVYLYYAGSQCAGEMGDPSMVIVSPIEQRMNYVTFSTFNSGSSQYHFVNVVTNTEDVENIQLDGNSIASEFQIVSGNSAYSFARIAIEHGSHTLSTTGNGFVGHVYGLGDDESYAYSVGSNALQDLYTMMLVNGQSASSDDTDVCDVTVNFDLNYNYNVSQVNWTFGDGQTGSGIPITHQYADLGDYPVSCDVYKLDVNGNDSLVATLTTELHIYQSYETEFSATSHNSYYWGDETFTASGDYEFNFPTIHGCDSIVSLHLTITHEVTTIADPTNGGVITGGGLFNQGQTCTLVATANAGYDFMCWVDQTGAVVSMEPTYAFEVMEDKTMMAYFVQDGFCGVKFDLYDTYGDGWTNNYLVVNAEYGDYQELTISTGMYVSYILRVADGSHVTLGWIPGSYIGECSFLVSYLNGNQIFYGGGMSSDFQFDFDMDCEGMPATPYVYINVEANPYDGGSVIGGGSFPQGLTHTLTAMPNNGYVFLNWTKEGAVVSTEPTYVFTVTEDVNYVANFEPINYTITAEANSTEGGTVNGGGTYYYGEECTLTATANYGYSFLNWTKGGVPVSTDLEYSFIVMEDADFVANFVPSPIGQVIAEYYPEVNNSESQYVRVYWDFIGEALPHHYRIYRTRCEGNLAMVTLADEVTDTQYIDTTWENTTYGLYKYGVSCVYEDERETGINWAMAGNKARVPAAQPQRSDYSNGENSCGPAPFASTPKHTNLPVLRGEDTECIIAQNGYNFGHFTLNNPSEVTLYDFSIDNFTQGACYVDGTYYFSNSSGTFGVFSPETGLTVIATGVPYGQTIEYNPVDGKMYGTNTYGELYEVNRYDGSYTYLTNLSTSFLLSFTITNEGRFILCDGGDECIKEYDPVTGELIPLIYVDWNINYGQDMAMDRETNEVYWAACNATESTHPLIKVNLSDYTLTYIGEFETQVAAFANATMGGNQASVPVWSNCIEKPLGDMCEVVFDMYDSYGDGWTGNQLVLNFEDGSAQYVTLSSGSYGSETLLIETGSHVTLTWISGSYLSECSFTISYPDGTVIYEGTNLNGTSFEFDVDCDSAPTTYSIVATAMPAQGGTVTGGGTFTSGESCTLTATANEGYTFINWTKDNEVVSTETNYTFSVTEDATYVAHFSSDGYYWDVDVYQYPDNMSVTGIIQIEGVEQFSADLEVGAFCNDECRGREKPVLLSAFNRYYLYLTVYGVDGDVIEFRLYDHATGMESDKVCETTLAFETNSVIGDIVEPYVFNFVGGITQTTDFAAGWNWWSCYVELGEDGLMQLEEGLGPNGQTIKSQSDGFASYLEGFGWYGALTNINNESTYQIRATQTCAVDITGSLTNPSDHPISLNPGWSWIGYPVSTSMSVLDAFSNFTPASGDMVKSQNDGFASYLEGFGWYGALNTLYPSIGLQYKSLNNVVVDFTYPNGSAKGELKANQTTEGNHWQPNLNAFADNMSVMAVVELDNVELNGENYELAAFANGECRGSARLMYVEPLNRYMAFLTVAGDEVTELYFGLYNTMTGEEIVGAAESVNFSVNAVLGSFAEPYVVSFRGTTGVDEWARSLQVFPNPVDKGQTFSLGNSETGAVRVEIINALGVVETLRATSLQTIAAPNVAGIYTLRITVEGKGTCYCRLVVK